MTTQKQPKQLRTKDIPIERDRLYKLQNGLCAICKQPLKSEDRTPHLEHSHASEPHAHHIRGLAHASCNLFAGAIWKAVVRSGKLNELGVDKAVELLDQVAHYYKQDYSSNAFHPNRLTDLVKKFTGLNKTQQQSELTRVGVLYERQYTQPQLVKLYKSYLKENK